MKVSKIISVATGYGVVSRVAGDVQQTVTRLSGVARDAFKTDERIDRGLFKYVVKSPFAGSYVDDEGVTVVVMDTASFKDFDKMNQFVYGHVFGGDNLSELVREVFGDKLRDMVQDSRRMSRIYTLSGWGCALVGLLVSVVTMRPLLLVACLSTALFFFASAMRYAVYGATMLDGCVYDIKDYIKKYGVSFLFKVI